MTDATPLDTAHAAMRAEPSGDGARLRYFGTLAGTMLHVLLEDDTADAPTPRTAPVDGVPYVLAFDTSDRLAGFVGAAAPVAEMPGRAVTAWLAGAGGAGLAINPGLDSAEVLPPEALAWLADMLAPAPAPVTGRPEALLPPGKLAEPLLTAVDRALARAVGLAAGALLARARWRDGSESPLLAILSPAPGAEPALARAVAEALRFSGFGDDALDVTFLPEDDALAARLGRVGLRIALPRPDPPAAPAAPGSDPERPPILRR